MLYKTIGLERRGKLLRGIFLKTNKNKVEVYLETGEKVSILEKKIFWNFQTPLDADNEKTMKIGLAEMREKFSKDSIDLATIWECLEENQAYKLEDLIELYFSEITETAAQTMFNSISDDNLYFDWKDGKFYKISENLVEERLKKQESDGKKKEIEEKLIKWLKGEEKDCDLSLFEKFIESLKTYALEGENSNCTEGKRLASILSLNPDEIIILLEQKNILEKNINETIFRYKLNTNFSKEIKRESESIIESIPDYYQETIEDIWSIAIDDADTDEVDDAISYRIEENFIVIGVHIADVAFTINPNSALDKFAKERYATLYFPEIKYSLFPIELVKERLTLKEKEKRPCISGLFYFNQELELEHYEFKRTLFSLNKRVSYEETSDILKNEMEFSNIYNITKKLQENRLKLGAIIFDFPEISIKVKDEEIIFKRKEKNNPGYLVVSELMVLFNSSVAKKLSENNVPALYRIQSPSSNPIELNEDDPLLPLKIRFSAGPTSLSLTPGKHYSLGVDCYTQASSPIRRYSDLLMHRQLISIIEKKEPLYSESSIQEIKPSLEQNEKFVKLAEFERNIFWFYKYLRKNKSIIYRGIVSRIIEANKTMVFIPDLMQEFPYKFENSYYAKVGQEIFLRVIGSSPRKRKIYFSQYIKKDKNYN